MGACMCIVSCCYSFCSRVSRTPTVSSCLFRWILLTTTANIRPAMVGGLGRSLVTFSPRKGHCRLFARLHGL